MTTVRDWLARLLVGLNVVFAGAILFSDSYDGFQELVRNSGWIGVLAISTLIFFGVVVLLDVFVNDILPDCYALKAAREYRHTIYMLISLGCLSIVFVLVKTNGVTASILHYGLIAWASVALAIHDIRERLKVLAK